MDLYELYQNMDDKYGFNEGQTPAGIEEAREALIEILNDGINKRFQDNQIEAHAVDRMGVHNWCLIGWRNKVTHEQAMPDGREINLILSEAVKAGWGATTSIKVERN